MSVTYVLYNPLAANGRGNENAHRIEEVFPDCELVYKDITVIEDLADYVDGIPDDIRVVVSGGDGTLNRLANQYSGRDPKREIIYFPSGSGNDFMADILSHDAPGSRYVLLNEYLKDLPTVEVKGNEYYFVNGIGYGIDGYCCEEGDKIREKTPGKAVNYTAIALKGAFFFYHPTNATVTVDGVVHKYERVWLAPVMNGRFYGGGMMIAPDQDRLNKERSCSVVVAHNLSRLKLLILFKQIFSGTHVKNKDVIDVLTGHEITVEFDRPTALQIDGETVTGVLSYKTKSKIAAKK